MTRTSPRRIPACLAAGVLTALAPALLVPAAPAGAAPGPAVTGAGIRAGAGVPAVRQVAQEQAPLRVTIGSLSPSALPAGGRVTVTGEVTNASRDDWDDLKVYLLTSQSPMTSAEELAAGAASDPAAEIGSRNTTEGRYALVGDLAPGKTVRYRLSVPVRELEISGEPGVYWLGVHVLGAVDGGRDTVADGRARTFLPLVPSRARRTDLSVVVPVTREVARGRELRLREPGAWSRDLSEAGRLGRLAGLSDQAAGRPLTWLLDPAVLDAARSLADGNPPLDTAPTDGSADPAASASPSPSPSDGASGSESPDPEPDPETLGPRARQAVGWLQLVDRQAAGHTVMTLPYGDLDVASALHRRQPRVYRLAGDLSATTVDEAGLTATPVVAPASGYLPAAALRRIDPGVPVLLGTGAFPDAERSVAGTRDGVRVLLADPGASAGGPSPDDRWSALAVRQRLLAESALRSLAGGGAGPLVARMPRTWDPGEDWARADFFAGLDVPWVRLVDLPSALVAGGTGTTAARPSYPRAQERREVPFANLLASQELAGLGQVFAGLLTRNDTVDTDLAKAGMLASSTAARAHPVAALKAARSSAEDVRERMREVRIEPPRFVTMSSEEGPVQITVVNDLDQEVAVAVKALTGSRDVRIAPSDPITLGPGDRASVRLAASARQVGVHSVTLVATDSDGRPVGSTARFTVRTSNVGRVIWAIMAVGGAVLVLAIARRLVRRVRARGGRA